MIGLPRLRKKDSSVCPSASYCTDRHKMSAHSAAAVVCHLRWGLMERRYKCTHNHPRRSVLIP
jgi:hypothetical protein